MVELRPAALKLDGENGSPDAATFDATISEAVPFRTIDLFACSGEEPREWENGPNTAVIQLNSPSPTELAELVCAVARIRPRHIDYMHMEGECCVVYWMNWDE